MIKATFKNIGPIKEAELELGNLTIIAGQNNTGKTYLAYTLYGFLDFWSDDKFPIYHFSDYPKKHDEKIKEIAKQIEKTGTATMLSKEYQEIRNWLVKTASKFFSTELIHQVFSSPRSEFENAHFQFKPQDTNQTIKHTAYLHSGKNRVALKSFFRDKNLVFELDDSGNVSLSKIAGGVYTLFERIARNNDFYPYILSTERFGISLFYKELDFTKNRLVEELQNLSDDSRFDPFRFLQKQSARYARPIKDNIDFTRNLENIQKKKGTLTMDRRRSVDVMMDAYYRAGKDGIRFISWKRGENKFNIPLHLASSSARGLSDLYFYLKHLAEPGQMLIIDEPESHLSPANQILMARLLVFCVNNGIKVLITTHSDYIIKEINNLIILHSDFKEKNAFLKKPGNNYTEDDHLNPASVKAYICEKGGVTPCPVDERGIDNMTVFDDAIEDINQVSMELDMYMDLHTTK